MEPSERHGEGNIQSSVLRGPVLEKGLAFAKANKSTAGYDREAGRRDHTGPCGPRCGHGLTPSIMGTPGGCHVAFDKVTGGRICYQAMHGCMRGHWMSTSW